MSELAVKPCEECPRDMRAVWGCPFADLAGKGKPHTKEPKGAPADPWRTCPEGLSRQPAVAGVWNHAEDYKRGALGDVRNLPAPYLSLMRWLVNEQQAQEAWLSECIHAD